MTKPSSQVSAPTHTREGAQALSDTRNPAATTSTISDETSRTSSTTQTSQAAEGSITSSTQKEAREQTELTYREHRATPSSTRKQYRDSNQKSHHTYAWRVANRFWRAAGAARSDRTGVGR